MPSTQTPSKFEAVLTERIEAGKLDLPMLPKVASMVISLTRDESTDASALSRLIQGDQALAGHVMRVANSPVFRGRTASATLQQAIARMGMNVICEIAVAISLRGKVFCAPGQEERISVLWKHALATGTWGKEIARVRRRNVESTFLCGLLRDIGKPILVQQIVEIASDLKMQVDKNSFERIMETHGPTVGATVARIWQLPAPVIETIVHSRDYSQATEYRDEIMMTHAAGHFADWLISASSIEEIRELSILHDLNLYPDDVDSLFSRREEVQSLLEAMVL